MIFGENETIIDLSHMTPQMPSLTYVFLPPIPADSKEDLEIDTIPTDPDLYPYKIDIITGSEGKTNTETLGVV